MKKSGKDPFKGLLKRIKGPITKEMKEKILQERLNYLNQVVVIILIFIINLVLNLLCNMNDLINYNQYLCFF